MRRVTVRRLIVCILIADIAPIIGLYILYNSPLMDVQTHHGILIAAFASLSVFSLSRILHGIVLNRCSATWFYTDEQIEDLKKKNRDPDPFFWHLGPGLGYIVIYVGIAFIYLLFI